MTHRITPPDDLRPFAGPVVVPSLATALGTAIKRARTARGLTQGELAQRVGISQSWLCQIERGNRVFAIDVLEELLRGLGVTMVVRFEDCGVSPTMEEVQNEANNQLG